MSPLLYAVLERLPVMSDPGRITCGIPAASDIDWIGRRRDQIETARRRDATLDFWLGIGQMVPLPGVPDLPGTPKPSRQR